MAWEITGVGVKPRASSTRTSTPLAAKTSKAVSRAGSDRAWVSFPRWRGPRIPAPARYSATAWAMARTWASLKLPASDDPRCPEVPKATRSPGVPGSGERSW
jgi:hypothetical protein